MIIKETFQFNPLDNLELFDIVEELNQKIQNKCNQLKLDVKQQMIDNISSLLVCLYYEDICISQITLNFLRSINYMEISSKTLDEYTLRKYNKLLRAIIILLSNHIKIGDRPLEYIKSDVVNYISAWTLNKEYQITYNDKKYDELFKQNDDKSLFKELYDNITDELIITINIKNNLIKAKETINKLVSTLPENLSDAIICP